MGYRTIKIFFLTLLLSLFVSVQGAQATFYFGRYRALVIGNRNYQYLDDLETPLVDAQKVAQVLQEQYGFKVELLLNADKNQIMQAISALYMNAKKEDNLLIYYAGHGELDDDSTLGYWQPIEAGVEAYKDYTWVPTIWITRKLKAVRARHVLIIADSCYSGGLSRSGLSVRRPETTDWTEWFRRMHGKQSRTALTSGGEEPVLDGGGSGHSVFARAFLEALQENQGILDGNSLFDHLKAAVANVSPQTPEYNYIPGTEGNRGDFLFVPKRLHGLSLEKIEKDKSQVIRRFRGGAAGTIDPPEPVEAEYRARKIATVRQRPSVGSARIGRLSKGDAVWVAGRVRDGRGQAWYLVDYEQNTQGQGYVYASLLQKSVGAVNSDERRQQEPVTVQTVASRKDTAMIDPTTGMKFVYIPKGCFQMGSPVDEKDRDDDEGPVHEVCVNGFWMGKYEVTQGQWKKIMGDNPAKFKKGDKYPVEQVSWEDVQKFIAELNKRSGKKYRLPTEAEWEYAARARSSYKYSGGDNLEALAWYNGNSGSTTHQVGQKKANAFGLYDMSGNVWEWCNDWYEKDYYASSPEDNPTGPSSGRYRVCRGGSWDSLGWSCRSASRYWFEPVDRRFRLGFRLARGR